MSIREAKIPVAVLTGFLGSGKTSVLNRLVRDPGMADALVVVNEFGEIGLDHELVASPGDVVLLRSGCLCCTLRSDLVETLCAADAKAAQGEVPAFERVVVETTGLAEPEPIMQALIADPDVARRFALSAVVTTVDALHGAASLERHLEATKQAAVADRLLITKVDLASSADVAALEQRLRGLNPRASVERITLASSLDPALLWAEGHLELTAHEPHGEASRRHGHDDHNAVRTVSFALEEPVPASVLDRWLVSLLDFQGPDLLRFKAIVNVAELQGPLVLQGVQHVLHPPLALQEWPSADRRTRMVFITCGLDLEALRARFAELSTQVRLAA
jgi:G3E family GTPase